jgi:hypothetical protein
LYCAERKYARLLFRTTLDRAIIAMILLYALALYALVGIVTAVAFVTIGITQVLPHSASVSAGARLLILPGAAVLWPYVLTRWLRSRNAA